MPDTPAGWHRGETAIVCFLPPTASWDDFCLPWRGPLPLVHRARQGVILMAALVEGAVVGDEVLVTAAAPAARA